MSYATLIRLSELHFDLGLIGINDFYERCHVAAWIFDQSEYLADPRDDRCEHREGMTDYQEPETPLDSEQSGICDQSASPQTEVLHFTYLGWIFTKADPDPYPSTPHGHWQNQNQAWPKLDPYNGRVFNKRHSEDVSKRLNKSQLNGLWSDERFKNFCRDHLVWYMETFPHHEFRVSRARLLRFPRY